MRTQKEIVQALQASLDHGDWDQARALVTEMQRLWPGRATTESAQGALAFRLKDYPTAVVAFRKAVALQEAANQTPTADSLHNLATVLDETGEKEEAQTFYRAVLKQHPTHLAALTQLAAMHTAMGRFDEAEALLQTALKAYPENGYTRYAMGSTLYEQGKRKEAMIWLDEAVQITPNLAQAHFHKALCALQMGNFAQGWEWWEWRWKIPQAQGGWPPFAGPLWNGEALGQKILLVWGEQGLGDNIQFLRYMAQVRQRWPQAGLAYWCPETLMPLVARFAKQHDIALLPREKAHPHNVRGYDCHLPLMSLPRLLKLRLEHADDWVLSTEYLQAPQDRLATWRERLEALCPRNPARKRVGLVWSGAKAFMRAERRNIALSSLTPWLELPNVDWISLQVGEASGEIAATAWADRLIDPTAHITDFADTSALAKQLDLIISVDTATAHAAAAAGCPVWLLSRFDSCWRWLLNRTDSPWYPSMQIFRQPKPLDWGPVVATVGQALASNSQSCRQLPQGINTPNGSC